MADVPLGAFLSGGLDSSTVVALMAEAAGGRVKTFTIGFAGHTEYDERAHARVVAERFATEHTEFVVEPKALDLVDRLVWHHDGPFGDSSAVPTYLLSELTRTKVTVALNGDGGDEVFAGYLRLYGGALSERVPRVGVPGGRPGSWASCPSPPTASTRSASPSASPRRGACRSSSATCAGTRTSRRICRALLKPELAASLDRERLLESFRASYAAGEGSTLARLLQLNFETYLLDDLLVKMDRMSMAHGLEARSPFLDTAVVEFGASLPDRLRMRFGKGKVLLRRAMKGILPESILTRGKMGFGAPLGAWFRSDLDGFVRERLLDPASPLYEYLRPEPVAELLTAPRGRDRRPLRPDLGAAHARELAAAGEGLGRVIPGRSQPPKRRRRRSPWPSPWPPCSPTSPRGGWSWPIRRGGPMPPSCWPATPTTSVRRRPRACCWRVRCGC